MKKNVNTIVKKEGDYMEQFIVGVNKIPNWFKEACESGRAKINYDEESGKLKEVILFNASGTEKCHSGDKIIKMRSGLSCIKREEQKKESK